MNSYCYVRSMLTTDTTNHVNSDHLWERIQLVFVDSMDLVSRLKCLSILNDIRFADTIVIYDVR